MLYGGGRVEIGAGRFPELHLARRTAYFERVVRDGRALGNQAERLSADELELLILSAALHDAGMTFTEDERRKALNDRRQSEDFLRKNCPEYLGRLPDEWPDDRRCLKQRYLRALHPFRVREVLERREE